MSAKGYTNGEIGHIRRVVDERGADTLGVFLIGDPPVFDPEDGCRWLATVDALRAQLEEAVGLLGEARESVDSLRAVAALWQDEEMRDALIERRDRIDAFLERTEAGGGGA